MKVLMTCPAAAWLYLITVGALMLGARANHEQCVSLMTDREMIKVFGAHRWEHVPRLRTCSIAIERLTHGRVRLVGDCTSSPLVLHHTHSHLVGNSTPHYVLSLDDGNKFSVLRRADHSHKEASYFHGDDVADDTALVLRTENGSLTVSGIIKQFTIAPLPYRLWTVCSCSHIMFSAARNEYDAASRSVRKKRSLSNPVFNVSNRSATSHSSRASQFQHLINSHYRSSRNVFHRKILPRKYANFLQVQRPESTHVTKFHRKSSLTDSVVQSLSSVIRRTASRSTIKWYPSVLIFLDSKLSNIVDWFYLSNLINAINLRFKSVRDPVIVFSLVGVVELKDSDLGFEPGTGLLLNQATEFLRTQFIRTDLPTFDIPLLIVPHPICETASCNPLYKGFATVNGVCDPFHYSFVIMEDFGAYSTVNTGSHELAHFLGLPHDEDLGDYCGNRFLMSSTPHFDAQSPHWSGCSLVMFGELARSSSHLRCLKSPETPITRQNLRGARPGLLMSRSEQCRRLTGTDVCRSSLNDCRCLYCRSPYNPHSCTCSSMPPDGTECGSGSTCEQGVCIKRFS